VSHVVNERLVEDRPEDVRVRVPEDFPRQTAEADVTAEA
jgi:hypothetical protein